MALDDALGGDGNSQLRDDLLRQYQQDAPDFSDDAGVLTERLARKLAPIGTPPSFQPSDFSSVSPPAKEKAAPDLSSYGTEVDPTPEPSTDDLASFGTPVAGPPPPPLGIGGQMGALGKGLLRGAPEQAGGMLQGTAALTKTQPISDEGVGLIDELGTMGDPDKTARDRAQLMSRALRAIGDRGKQMDFNGALQRIARGGDAQAEAAKLRESFGLQNAEAAKPVTESPLYKAGTAVKAGVDAAIPMTDQEKASIGGQVGSGISGALPYVAAAALAGPEAAILLGAAGMGTSTAGATFEAAKAKGASDADAAKAAGWGGAIGAVLGTLPIGTVLRPITAVSAKLGSSGAAILAQHAIEGGAAFATVGEAQEFLLSKVAQAYYDPEKGYSPDAKRVIANFLAGAVVGAGASMIPKPSQISSPADIAEFLRRAAAYHDSLPRGLESPGPIEGEVVPPRLGLPGPDTGAAPPPPPAGPKPTSPAGGEGAAATPPKTDHQTLLDAGFSETEIADMSPRARASRLEEANSNNNEIQVEPPGSTGEVAESPPKSGEFGSQSDVTRVSTHEESPAEATGKRDLPIVAKTADDVLKASEVVKEPKSPAQAEAENYQHGHLELPHLGLEGRNGISVETGVGQMRRGVSPAGEPWEVRMPVAYGRIKGTKGADAQPLDVFIGPEPTSPHVFIVDQRHAGTETFDEHKIMVGFSHPEGAMRAYKDSYADDAMPRIGAVRALGAEEFKAWLGKGDHTKRFSQPGANEIKKEPASAAHGNREEAGSSALTEAPSINGVPKVGPASGGTSPDRPTTSIPENVKSSGQENSQNRDNKVRAPTQEPLSLLQFIASKGGMAPHPELKALDLAGDHRVQIPGRSGFFAPVRPTGMPLDQMREAAEEAGYFRGDHNKTSTLTDFLDAIDTELRGQPHHAEGEEGSKSKRQRTSETESSAHARQAAVDHHHDEIEADADYKHLADDVKKRAAAIMADENLPLDDAVEQAAMRLVSEDADYAVTPQLMSDTYGKDVSREIQPRPAPRNGVVAKSVLEEEGHARAKQKAQGDGKHVPDTGAAGEEEPAEVAGLTPSQMRRLLTDEQEQIVNMWHRVKEPEPENASDHYKDVTRSMIRELAKEGYNKAATEDELIDMLTDTRLSGKMVKATKPETIDHREAIENVLGGMVDKVLPVDIARAVEMLEENPGMPPDVAFQNAVIEGAVNQGFLTEPEAEKAYGPEVTEVLGTGSQGASGSGAHTEQGSAEPREVGAGGAEKAGIVPGSGQAGGGQGASDTEAGDSASGQQPDTGRAEPDAERAAGRSTAPEHLHNEGKPLDRNSKFTPTATGASKIEDSVDESIVPLTMSVAQFKEITDEWAALFENPGERTNLETKFKNGPFIPLAEAQKRIDEWKAHAAAQGDDDSAVRQANSEKTVLSLFDLTGEWARPWAEAGYNVLTFDIQNGQDVHDFSVEYFNENYDFGEVYAILAATPCTDFAVSGARHFAAKDADGRTEASKELVFQTLRTIEYFRPKVWALENPVGRIESLTGLPKWRLLFNPNNFGAPYTKKTVLWGNFNEDLPTANVEPTEGSKMWSDYGGKSQATKNARSETPEGFSYAFFKANNAADLPAEKRLAGQYPEASGAIKVALDAGVTEDRINELMEDTYGNYEYEEARNALIREVAGLNAPEKTTNQEWWREELTVFGREQAVKAAKLKPSVAKTGWDHIKPAFQKKLAALRGTDADPVMERDAPTWAEVMHELPKDSKGRPDTDEAFRVMKELSGGETSYQNLTPSQKTALLDHFKPKQTTNLPAVRDEYFINIDGKRLPMDNLEAASKAYTDAIDKTGATVSGATGPKAPKPIITDAKGNAVGWISYNGRVWAGDPDNFSNETTKLLYDPRGEADPYDRVRGIMGQTTIPGTEPITNGELAQRKADQPLKPGAVQQPADEGLFGDGHQQTDLLDLKPAQESAHGVPSSVSGRDAGSEPEDVPGLEEGRGAGAVRPIEGERGSPDVSGADQGRPEGTGRPADDAGDPGSRGGDQGSDVRVSGRHDDQLAGREEGTVQRDARRVKGENHHIEPGGLAEDRSPRAKAVDNIQAIKLANRLVEEDRPATAAEQHQLARYVGWGGIKGAFADADGEYGKGFEQIGADLKETLTPEEYDTARRSIQYAHYTSEDIIGAMWKAAQQLGFEGGSVFEPGMGVGNFPGLMPTDVAERSTYQGVELDHVSARIAKLLYPKWGVRRDDFTRTPISDNAFDLAIGNPPFADIAIHSDPKYAKHNFLLHDYFFAKSLDAVRPGGLLMFVTSAGTMNKIDPSARSYLADRAEFVGGIRLPSNAFKKNAGTEVTTDILILRKRMPGEAAGDRAWTDTAEVSLPGPDGKPMKGQISRYFAEHPEMVLGKGDFADKLYEGRYSVKAWDNFDLKDALAVALTKLPRNVMKASETPAERAEADFDHTEKKQGSYYIDKSGELRQMQNGAGVAVARRGKGIEGGKSAEQIERIRGLVPIRDALRETYAADLAGDKDAGDVARAKLNAAYDTFTGKYGPINKAEIQLRRPSVVQQESARAEAREEARYAGLPFNEGDFDAGRMLDANRPMAEIARARKEAREKAIAESGKFDEGSFDPEDMKDNILDKRPNIEPFMDDQEAYRLRAIEHYDDTTGKASKGLVFSKNIITRDSVPKINSINDAALYVLNQKGRLDLDDIGALVKKSKSETIEALGDRIYRVPGTKDTWETKEAYLSGNVRKKLALAKKEAGRDSALRRNVEALEAAQPAPLAPAQIYAGLGMPWIPEKIVEQFAKEELGLSSFKAKYVKVLAQWIVSGDTDSVASITTFGTSRRNATALMSDALNHITPKIYDEMEDRTRVLNVTATQDAQDKLAAIKEKFKGWVFADDARADPLAAFYNENYNNLVVRSYDGSYLTTPGIASDWKWRPHQTRVISRIIQDGNTYMAHAVGAGKTSAMIGAGMEMRRLGLVKKPMYAVPNHMLAQFTKEFYEQYPTARIAVADDRNFHADRRKQFMANVALDDLDAVIITHTNFGMIPVSDDFSDGMIREEMDKYRNALSEMPSGQDSRITRSRIEKQIERLEQRLSGKSNRRRDNVFNFDEMGVDFLFVDEAQEFRKLDFNTQMSNLKGITPEGSGKAWDLYVKTKLLEKRSPGRNLVLASGTPVTNTMAELYTLSRYLQPGELNERGLSAFDAWAGAFGEEVSELEQDAAGGYKPVSRFAKFVNVAELSAMVRQIMDVVTSRQLEQYVTRPKIKGGKRQMHLAEKSPELAAYQDGLAARMVAIKNRGGKPSKGDDIMLTVIGDGRHAAIDMRLVGGESDPDFPSKLELLIDNVHQTIKDTARTKFYRPREGGYDMSAPIDVGPATQMVFSNLGISAKRGLPVHDYIRAELVRRGVPRDKIALISEYKTHIAKQKLFNDMNAGKVLVMIGSVPKMGTGVNAQRRLIAIHNLDPLWFPSDDEQRNGRGVRQGNWNPEIGINDYSTKGTYDSSMWGLMEKKARFIQGFFEGDPSLREMDDLGEASQYAQAKAMTTNDPRLMRLTELKQDLERADRRKSAFEQERYALKRRQAEARGNLDHYGAREVAIQQDIRQRQDVSGDKFKGTVAKKVYDKRAEFGEALLDQLDKVTTRENIGRTVVVGEVSGFPLVAHIRKTYTERTEVPSGELVVKRNNAESVVHGTSALGMSRSIESILSGFDSDLASAQGYVATAEKFLRESAGKESARFQGDPQIQELAQQVAALEAELSKKDETPAPGAEREPPSEEALATMEPLTEVGSAKRAELERLLTAAVKKMAPTVDIKFHDGRIPLDMPTSGWGADTMARYKGALGLYRPAKHLIELSFDSGTPMSAAFHEAYHAIEHLLQTQRERELMVKETPRIRKMLTKGIKQWTAKDIAQLDGAEVRAIGFELYRREREHFGKGQGLHVGARRWYHRLADMTRQIRNGINGLGFQTAEDIFEKAYEGGFADRQPVLLGTPYPEAADDAPLASMRNPFNGPLRDSVGEKIEEKLKSKTERLIEGYQNLNRPVQNLEGIIEARLAGELPDSQAFYQKKRLFPGKVAAEAADFNKNLLDPMIDLLKANNIDREEAGDILYALHAPERNREMDRINMDSMFGAPDMVLGRGSGMSNDTAATILGRYNPAVVEQIDQRASAIRDYINNMMVQGGLESAGTVEGWKQTYDHYIPLSGWEDAPEDAPPGFSAKFTVRGPEVRHAFGRKSKADNPLANLFDQAYRTIERAKKNEYLQALDNALHELEPDDLQGFVRFDQGQPKKELSKRTGLVRTVEDSNFRNEPGAVPLKRGGRVSYMIFENPQLAEAIKRMHADGLGIMQPLINIQNKLKATWTHYSPEFLVRHFLFRYPIEGTLNSFEQKESGQQSVGRYIADSAPFLGSASKAIFSTNKGVTHSDPHIAELQRYWEEMRGAGGAMMFRQMRDTNLVREHMESRLNTLTNSTWSNARARWQASVEAMDTVTNALDNALRLAAYAAARKQGKTPEQAAIIARDATVDFQQSGRWKNMMSLFAPFSSVAINTGARMTSAVARSRIMRQVFGASILAGFLSGMFNYLIGGDDKDGMPFADKMAWWEKSLTFTLMNPFDRDAKDRPMPIHIPMPYNWAFPLMIGQAAAAMVFTKDPHGVKKALGAVLKSGLEALTPFGAEHNPVAQITPELLRPIVHAYTNESWNGIPIHKEPAFQRGPRSESGRMTTGDGWKWMAHGLNTATGGDAKHSGVLDVYPEDLREVMGYYSGTDTIMRFGRNVGESVGNAVSGEPQAPTRIPFARVVRGTDYDASDKSRHYDQVREQKQPWTR